MKYPKYLLPNRYFRVFSLDELPKDPKFIVVRRSLASADDTFDEFGFVTALAVVGTAPDIGALDVRQVAGLSLNLLGGLFKLRHLRFRPVGRAMADWDPLKPTLKFSMIKDDIREADDLSVPIYFPIKTVHRQTFPYTLFDKDYKKHLPDELKAKNQPIVLDAETQVLHRPSNCNFWHVEFHVKDKLTGERLFPKKISNSDAQKPYAERKAGSRLAISAIENVLMKNGLPNVEKPGAIPKAVYFRPIHDLMKGYSLVAKWCKQLFISNEQKL